MIGNKISDPKGRRVDLALKTDGIEPLHLLAVEGSCVHWPNSRSRAAVGRRASPARAHPRIEIPRCIPDRTSHLDCGRSITGDKKLRKRAFTKPQLGCGFF